MLRARSGIRRLRPGASPLSISQQGRLLLRPPSHAPPAPAPLAALVFPRQPDRGLAAYGRKRLGSDPLARISAVVDYGSAGQVRSGWHWMEWWRYIKSIRRLAAASASSGNCNSLACAFP